MEECIAKASPETLSHLVFPRRHRGVIIGYEAVAGPHGRFFVRLHVEQVSVCLDFLCEAAYGLSLLVDVPYLLRQEGVQFTYVGETYRLRGICVVDAFEVGSDPCRLLFQAHAVLVHNLAGALLDVEAYLLRLRYPLDRPLQKTE